MFFFVFFGIEKCYGQSLSGGLEWGSLPPGHGRVGRGLGPPIIPGGPDPLPAPLGKTFM